MKMHTKSAITPYKNGAMTNNTDREAAIMEYAPLVKVIASRLAMRLPPHIDIDCLMSAGILGLIEAIDRFDPARGVKIETYLSIRIKGAMLDELRRRDWIPRTIREKAKYLEEEYIRLEMKLGRTPTEKEMAEHLGMEEEELQRLLQDTSSCAVMSLEDISFDEDGRIRSIVEYIADPNSKDPFESFELKEKSRILAQAVSELPEKERLILTLYYYEDLNLKEIGEVLALTESRVCQLHSQAILRLKGKLKRLRGKI